MAVDNLQMLGFVVSQNRESGELSATSGGRGGKGGWLMALATAMGGIMGDRAANMVSLMDKLQTLNDQQKELNSDSKGNKEALEENAREFNLTMTQFQAESQMFGIISNASSTAIKSIGEGLTSLARKQ